MAIRVTMRIFSCRANPVRVFTGSAEARVIRILNSLPFASGSAGEPGVQRTGGLGFRGFLVEPVLDGRGRSSTALASWVSVYGGAAEFDQARSRVDDRRVTEYGLLDLFLRDLESDIAVTARREARDLYGEPHCRRGSPGRSASLPGRKIYAPAPWNANGVVGRNNCYNYANNVRFTSGNVATPGAGGNQPAAFGSCATVSSAVRADHIRNLGALPHGRLPDDGWPIALFIKPGGSDIHFYRQDRSGRWSHKPGGWPVRSCDEGGAPITDIRNADTLGYVFCGLFETDDDATIEPL